MNNREDMLSVLSAVEDFDARSARELASKERFLVELGRLDRPFDRGAGLGHVTGSAIVVGQRGTLLHRHKRLHRWLQPGGHVDVGEMPWEAALRETQEETGLVGRHPGGVPRFIHLDVHRAGEHVHLDLRYLLECDDEEPSPGPGESLEVQWFNLPEALDLADEGLVGALLRLEERAQ